MARTLVLLFCVTILVRIEPVTTEFNYVDHVFNPVGTIQRNHQVRKELAPLLHSEDFWEWTQQLNNRRSMLRAAVLSSNSTGSDNGTDSTPTSAGGNSLFNLIDSLFGNGNTSLSNNGSDLSAQLGQLIGNGLSQFLGNGLSQLLRPATPGPRLPVNDSNVSHPPSNGGLPQTPPSVNSFQPQRNTTPVEAIFDQLRGSILYSNASDECKKDAITVAYGLQTLQPWALKMFDASAKIPTDLLNLDLLWLGSYDECYSEHTVAEIFLHPSLYLPPVEPRYCEVSVKLPLLGSAGGILQAIGGGALQVGTCLPKACSPADTAILANLLLGAIPLGNVSLKASSSNCPPTPGEVPYETKDIAVIALLSVLGLLIVVGTAYEIIAIEIPKFLRKQSEAHDEAIPTTMNGRAESNGRADMYKLREKSQAPPAYSEKATDIEKTVDIETTKAKDMEEKGNKTTEKKSVLIRILLAFSVYSNGKKILSTSQPKGALTAVNGIRFLSMSWVILGHSAGFVLGFASNSMKYGMEFLQSTSAQAIANALVSVDTFFVLSGLLTSYLLLKQMKKTKGRVNWFLFYFHRYWRLTPIYMIMIGLFVTLFNHVIFGPQRPASDKACEKYWWMNLLYINNFVNDERNLCLAWSWYLNNDMQFYILSPLMIVPLFFKELLGVVISVVFLLGTTITAGLISYTYQVPPSSLGGGDESTNSSNFMALYYIRPYCRMGPYICGVLTGYILYKTKGKCRINIYLNLLGWVIATGCACGILYGLSDAFSGGHRLNVDESAVYNALHRSVWGAAVCWVIFTCATGNAGFINTILSWSVFVPLSRLTYAAYLVHILIMYIYYFGRTMPIYMTNYELVYLFLGNLVMSYSAAFVLSLVFESPFMALEKIMFSSRAKK